MPNYEIREAPNINDPDLIRCCIAAQQMRGVICAMTRHIVDQLSHHPVTIPTRVAWAILNRMVESSLSIEILCAKNRVRDAAILLLSLFEIKFDAQYIALDPETRAKTWIDHAKESTKPWKVASQMREIYTRQEELDAEKEVYCQYSMVKHCNPASGAFGFPMAVSRNTIELDLGNSNSPWIRVHLLGLGWCLHDTGKAAAHIWSEQGLDVGSFEADLKKGADAIWQYNQEHIVSLLRGAVESSKAGAGED